MIRITRLGESALVSKGAFKEFFEKSGWVREDEKIDDLRNEKSGEEETAPEAQKNADSIEETAPETDAEEDDEEDEDDLSEKPLSEMTKRELRTYADLNGIDLDDVEDRKDAIIKAIKEAMQE